MYKLKKGEETRGNQVTGALRWIISISRGRVMTARQRKIAQVKEIKYNFRKY